MAINRSPELYLLKAAHVPGDTWGRATFGSMRDYLNKLGRGPFGDAIHTNYQDSRPNGFRQEYFSCFTI